MTVKRRKNELDTTLPVGEDKAEAVLSLFERIAPRYDLINRLMTFGLDQRWRKHSIDLLYLHADSLVADLATGTGDFLELISERGHRCVGFDFSANMLAAGQLRDSPKEDSQVFRVRADVTRLPVPEATFDAATCGFALRNIVDLQKFFEEIARVVKPGATITLLDASEPKNPLIRLGHHIYFHRIVPLVGAALSDRSAYRYLPKSLTYLPEPAVLKQQLSNAGFVGIERKELLFGAVQIYSARKAHHSTPSHRHKPLHATRPAQTPPRHADRHKPRHATRTGTNPATPSLLEQG